MSFPLLSSVPQADGGRRAHCFRSIWDRQEGARSDCKAQIDYNQI